MSAKLEKLQAKLRKAQEKTKSLQEELLWLKSKSNSILQERLWLIDLLYYSNPIEYSSCEEIELQEEGEDISHVFQRLQHLSNLKVTLKKRKEMKESPSAVPTPSLNSKKKRKSQKREDRNEAKYVRSLPVDSHGILLLPCAVGKRSNEVSIVSIGHILPQHENFHTNRYIFPVGYKSTRVYTSFINPSERTTYSNTIDFSDETPFPVFSVVAEDAPNEVFTANSSSGVWKKVLDRIAEQGHGVRTHASGPDLFGLSDLRVLKCIQELPGAEKCSRYVFQKYKDQPSDGEEDDE